jgi:hypothetical protein
LSAFGVSPPVKEGFLSLTVGVSFEGLELVFLYQTFSRESMVKYYILANMRNSHGINKMTYVAKSAFILAK